VLKNRNRILVAALAILGVLALPRHLGAADYVVYSVYKELDLGFPGEAPQKDFFVNMGTAQGVHPGTLLKVYRRVSTYDLMSEKLYRDVSFPIARLKVIHAENNAAICRLEKDAPGRDDACLLPALSDGRRPRRSRITAIPGRSAREPRGLSSRAPSR
jgi:hypothetical protein